MTAGQIRKYLKRINDVLASSGAKGEMCLYGGAVMCLVYKARPATKDVDAIFEPAKKIREAAKIVADENKLPEDWLNDAVKGFLSRHQKKVLFSWPNLTVHVPEPEYILAMKLLAVRVDTHDKQDIKALIRDIGIKSEEGVFRIMVLPERVWVTLRCSS